MIKEFNNLKEIQKYYVKETNTYVFKEDGDYIDLVKFNFNLNVKCNIDACDIKARNINAMDIYACDIEAGNINAMDINAWDINAWDINASDIKAWDINASDINAYDIKADDISANNINANDISYYVFCIAYNNITCKSIKGRRVNSFHKALDGKIIINGVNNESKQTDD